MDIGSLFLLLALLLLVSIYIARPLLDREAVVISAERNHTEHEISTLLAERDRVLASLQELDFDYALGKISESDYPSQRTHLLQRGADILRQLDEYEVVTPDREMEERIEAELAERRAAIPAQGSSDHPRQPTSLVTDADDEVEVQLAARRRSRQDKSAGFCPQCGRPIQVSDRFCPKCGNELA
jgi:hypothetical protein